MKIAIVGCGHVGLVYAAGLAHLGHEVQAFDIDDSRLQQMQNGEAPFFEPGLAELLQAEIAGGRLRFSGDILETLQWSEIVFCTVGTPLIDEIVDVSAVYDVAENFAKVTAQDSLRRFFVLKSTVPVGTSQKVAEFIREKALGDGNFELLFHPEFLREGVALKDFFEPSRIVMGMEAFDLSPEQIQEKVFEVYEQFVQGKVPMIFTSLEEAELIKYVSNAFLAVKISFANEMAQVCDVLGVDVTNVMKGAGHDPRIGLRFLGAGIGYGGSCLPKDVRALLNLAAEKGLKLELIEAAEHRNCAQVLTAIEMLEKSLGNLSGKKLAVWGLSYKAETSDIRGSRSVEIIEKLLEKGAEVCAYDPRAGEVVRKYFGEKVEVLDQSFEAVNGADALLVLTNWEEFSHADFNEIFALMKGKVIFDGRNFLDAKKLRKLGFEYLAIGRSAICGVN